MVRKSMNQIAPSARPNEFPRAYPIGHAPTNCYQANAQKNVTLLKESEAEKEDMRKSEREAVDTAKKVRRSVGHDPVQRYTQQNTPLNYAQNKSSHRYYSERSRAASERERVQGCWGYAAVGTYGAGQRGVTDWCGRLRVQGVSSMSEFCRGFPPPHRPFLFSQRL